MFACATRASPNQRELQAGRQRPQRALARGAGAWRIGRVRVAAREHPPSPRQQGGALPAAGPARGRMGTPVTRAGGEAPSRMATAAAERPSGMSDRRPLYFAALLVLADAALVALIIAFVACL